MIHIVLASVAALALMSSGASAQTQIIEKRTTIQPETLAPPVPAPGATVTESTRSKTYNADGTETTTRETVKQNSSGGVSSTSRSSTIAPDGSSTTTTREKVTPGYGGTTTESTTTTTIER